MPDKIQPNRPRDQGSRPSLCTGNGCKTPEQGLGPNLTWPSLLNQGCSTTFLLKVFSETHHLASMYLQNHSRASPTQEVGSYRSKYLCGHVPMWIKHLPSFGSIGAMTRAADLPLALGLAVGPLGEVLDLIWPDPPPLNQGCCSTFVW